MPSIAKRTARRRRDDLVAHLSTLAKQIRDEIGVDRVVDDPDVMASYETDWTGRYKGRAGLVVRPTSAEELTVAIRLSTAAGASVVAQGGNTGLVGGGVPREGEVVISTSRMTGIDEGRDRTEVVVAAGEPLSSLQRHARQTGMAFGVDLASRESATIGGMVATNAGGIHAVRWGRMRSQVLGLEVVLQDGQVLDHLTRAPTGGLTDLVDLFTGSEGALGIISRVRIRLVPDESHKVVALLTFDGLESAVGAAAALKAGLSGLDAVEYFGPGAVELVGKHRGVYPPFGRVQDAYLLVECSASEDPSASLLGVVEEMQGLQDSAVAVEPGPRRNLWELRESITESISATGVPQKHDVWLPPSKVPDFDQSLTRIAAEAGAGVVLFGHLAEGSLHANVIGLDPDDRSLEDAIYQLVLDLGGNPISEHGVGTTKLRWQREMLDPLQLDLMWSVKHQFDPKGLLNPGVLVPPR